MRAGHVGRLVTGIADSLAPGLVFGWLAFAWPVSEKSLMAGGRSPLTLNAVLNNV